MSAYGCTDHGCVFGHPGGMGTNGGCKCLDIRSVRERVKARNGIMALRAERDALMAAHPDDALDAVATPPSARLRRVVEALEKIDKWITDEQIRGRRTVLNDVIRDEARTALAARDEEIARQASNLANVTLERDEIREEIASLKRGCRVTWDKVESLAAKHASLEARAGDIEELRRIIITSGGSGVGTHEIAAAVSAWVLGGEATKIA